MAPFFRGKAFMCSDEAAMRGACGALPVNVVGTVCSDRGKKGMVECLVERERPGTEDHDGN